MLRTEAKNMVYEDLRQFLNLLEQKLLLARVKTEVDPAWEINGITMKVGEEAGPAVLFEKIKGYTIPLVSGIFGTPERYALALETSLDKLKDEWIKRTERPIEPRLVDSGPCKDNILLNGDVDLTMFPQPLWHEKDSGPHIGTMGVVFTKDPETEEVNAGIYKLISNSKNDAIISLEYYRHIGIHNAKWEAMGKPMPVAVAIGVEPALAIVAATDFSHPPNEIELAGGLKGAPVKMVQCETIDMEVPATAEVVLEGEVLPHVQVPCGVFGELMGYYGTSDCCSIFKVKAVTYKNNPIFQGTREGLISESGVLTNLGSELELYKYMKSFPGFRDLTVLPTSKKLSVVVSIEKQYPEHPRNIMDAVWESRLGGVVKFLTVVDEDINILNPRDVVWAIATRVQPDRDITITSGGHGLRLDPSQPPSKRFLTSHLGIDATKPTEEYEAEGFRFPDLSSDMRVKKKVEEMWDKYGIKY